MNDLIESEVDHHVWEAYYIPNKWDDPSDKILASSKEKAMQLIAEKADVPNTGWKENNSTDHPLYQLRQTTHHIVTVVQKPVYE